MNYEEAKDFAKSQLPVLLENQGINVSKNFHCLKPEHEDEHPSMSYDKNTNRVKCFACGASGDIFDVVGWIEGITDPAEKFRRTYEILGIEIDEVANHQKVSNHNKKSMAQSSNKEVSTAVKDYTKLFKYAKSQVNETNYFKGRGLSEKIIEKAKLGYIPDFQVKIKDEETGENKQGIWKAAIVPRGSDRYTVRKISGDGDNPKDKVRKFGPGKSLYAIRNISKMLDDSAPIYVVEGEFDALSIEEVGGKAIALGSTSYTDSLLSTLEEAKKGRRLKAPIIICLDNDDVGKKATKKLAEEFKKKHVQGYAFNIYGESKDANEALITDRDMLKKKVDLVNQSPTAYAKNLEEKAYRNECSAGGHIQDFIDGIKTDTPCYRTGYQQLDAAMDGGLYEGLYLLSAQTSCGKTTLAEQIAENVAKLNEDTDVLIFALEMSRFEMMAKSISRLTFENTFEDKSYVVEEAKTVRDITVRKRYSTYSEHEKKLIQKSVEDYSMYADHIFIFEGIGNIGTAEIKEAIKRHVKMTGNRKLIVLVDYLQILKPFDVRATDKQSADHNVLNLKKISRDLKIPIIAISSQNRMSYNKKSDLQALKESGALEYSADVVFGLNFRAVGEEDFDIDVEKEKETREMSLSILKQRNGLTGKQIAFDYIPKFNYFEETSENI